MSSTVTDVKAYQWYAGGQSRDVVRMATFGSFFHQGQICLNTRKIIIQRAGDAQVQTASPISATLSGSTR
jgi:acyl-CoA reductase-like NAD-dependent aldehyde dehydrogenase